MENVTNLLNYRKSKLNKLKVFHKIDFNNKIKDDIYKFYFKNDNKCHKKKNCK